MLEGREKEETLRKGKEGEMLGRGERKQKCLKEERRKRAA